MYPGLQQNGATNSGSARPANFAFSDRKITGRSSAQAANPGLHPKKLSLSVAYLLLVINVVQQYLVVYNARQIESASVLQVTSHSEHIPYPPLDFQN